MRPNKVRQILWSMFFGGLIGLLLSFIFISKANADGVLSRPEQAYADNGAAVAVCRILNEEGVTYRSLANLTKAVATVGDISLDNAVDVVNYSVLEYCPVHWPALVAFGDGARSAEGGRSA